MSTTATVPAGVDLQALLASLQAMATGSPASKSPASHSVTDGTEKRKAGKSRDKATKRELEGKEPRDVSKLDQQLATDRDSLVAEGFKVLSVGMTSARINFAMRVVSWARATSPAGGESGTWEAIDAIGASIIRMGNGQECSVAGKKHITLKVLAECVKLAALATYVPDVAKLDFYVACMFNRFMGKKFKVTKPEVLQLKSCQAIVKRVLSREPELIKASGAPDRKAIRAAIDAILGARKSAVKDTGGVTSVHAVANWFAAATDDDLLALAEKLSDDVKCRFVEVIGN